MIMKSNKPLFPLYLLAALLCGFLAACEETPALPTDYPTEGDIHFSLQAGGDSLDNAPLAVGTGDTLSISVSQKSSYTDPNGSVFTCEPKATIGLFATADTIYAKDIESLLEVGGNPKVTTSQSGTNPVLHSTSQKFVIGGQEVVFDLGHEVYSYVNSLSDVIEMPYVKVNRANFGRGNATESGGVTRNTSPSVTLRALSLTRASVTDSAMFEVSAKFSLELESVNTKTENKQTLEFDVTYVGVVENVTELYGSVVYTISHKDGEAKSPFIVNGADSLLLEIRQNSTYAAADTAVYASEPKATIGLKVKNDTAFVEKHELLSTLIDTEDPKVSTNGDNPASTLYERLFATSSQEFLFETMYEVYKAESGDEMPYLMVGEPKCIGIEVTEQKQEDATRAFVYDTVYYDVKAKFEVELKGVNVSDELANTLEFEVNYVGGVINATEVVELVNITYRKNQVFYEGHDNLIPRSQCEVYRDRHYSDGHVETDEFFGAPWFWVESNVTLGCGSDVVDHFRDTTVTYLPGFTVRYENFNRYSVKTDSIYVYQRGATCIPSFENVELVLDLERNEVPDRYDETYGAELEDHNFNPDSPIEGWYVKDHVKSCRKLLRYAKDGNSFPFRGYLITMSYYDRFLCVDDTIIGFEEFRPEIESFETFDDYAGSDVHGPGKIYQYIIKGEYLDHTFYYELTDTIYTPKGTIVEKDDRDISVALDEPTDVTYGKATLHARVEGHEGEVFSGYGFYVLQPHTGKWVFFEADNVSEDGSNFSATVTGMELGQTHQYYARLNTPIPISVEPIVSDTQTFTTQNRSISTDEAVDLGLSVKWASHNFGATNMQGYGTTFHKWPATDVVESQWGEDWRLPTAKEAEELIEHCHQEWISYHGRQGLLLMANNGNAIFLPAVGLSSGSSIDFECVYLTSTEYTFWDGAEGYVTMQAYKGQELGFRSVFKKDAELYPIRPVRE